MEERTILGGTPSAEVPETQVTGDPAAAPADDPAAAQAQAFDYSGMIDKDGFFAENWRDSLPEELRNEPCLDNMKNISMLAKSYINSQKMIGRNKIAIPGENASQDELDAFFSALGRPAAAADYKHDKVELPEGVALDESALNSFREFAFKNGLSQSVYEQALAFDIQRVRAAQEAAVAAHNAEHDATFAKLEQQYGKDLPARIAQVDKALTTFGIKDIFVEKGLTNNYQIFEALANIGSRISESRLKEGEGVQQFKSPQQQLEELYADPKGAIYNMDHPGHEKAVAEAKRLMSLMNRE